MLPQWRIVVVQSRFGVRKLNLNESEGEWVKERQIQINTITEATKVIKLTNELAYSSKFESTWETQVKLEWNSLMGRLIWFIFCTFGVEPLSIFSLFLNLCSFSLNHFSSLWLRVTFSYMEIVILIYHFHCSLFFSSDSWIHLWFASSSKLQIHLMGHHLFKGGGRWRLMDEKRENILGFFRLVGIGPIVIIGPFSI